MRYQMKPLAAIGAAIALSIGMTANAEKAPEITIRYAAASPATSGTSRPIVWWANEVEKRTNGRVKIEFFWSGSLVKGPDIFQAVSSGVVPMGKVYTMDLPGQMPLAQIANLPFTTEDVFVISRAVRDMTEKYKPFAAEFERAGVHRLGGVATGTTDILSKTPIRTLEDFKGKRIRVRGVQTQALKAVGAVPVSVPFGELYEALDRGIADGTTMYELSVLPYKFNEVSNHYTFVGLGHAMQAEVVNKRFWDRLPEDVRKVMTEAMADAEIHYARTFSQDQQSDRGKMKDGNGTPKVTFHRLPAESVAAWRKITDETYDSWVKDNKKHGDTAEMRKTFFELLQTYEARVLRDGYPKLSTE